MSKMKFHVDRLTSDVSTTVNLAIESSSGVRASASERSPEILALKLFSHLEREVVNYVIVGDSENYFHEITGDVDIVVDRKSFANVKDILFRFCRQHHVRIVQILRHEQTAWYFVLAWIDDTGRVRFLHPD